MWLTLCSGNLDILEKICTEGLYTSFRSRIAARARDERVRWTKHHDIRRPRVLTNRATALPIQGMKECGMRQVVVRLRSKQSLARLMPNKTTKEYIMVDGTDKEKDVTELLVIQRRMLNGKEEPWKVWGTTQESDVTDIAAGK